MEDSVVIKCNLCSDEFPNAYDLSKHMASSHPIANVSVMQSETPENLPDVIIRTTKDVEVCVNGVLFRGKELEVPFAQAGDIKRILMEGYGIDILEV